MARHARAASSDVHSWMRLLLWMAALLAAGPVAAATEYSITDGMSQNSALALVRDDDGFLWIGTEDGLNRFDGYEFRVYRPAGDSPAGIAASYVRELVSGGRYLYLATNGGGLAIFDRVDERFRMLGVADGLPADHLNTLELMAPGELYVGSRNGLALLQWQGDPMTAAMKVSAVAVGAESPRGDIWELRRGPSGLWVGTGDGVFRIDTQGHVSALDVAGAQRPFNIDALLEAPAGVLWIGSWDQGLVRMDLQSGALRQFQPQAVDAAALRSKRILSLAAAPGGSVYIGTDRGLSWYAPACDCLQALDHRRSARVAGRGFLVEALEVDERGGVFAGYWGEGLVRFTPNDLVFHVERTREEGNDGLNHDRVRALLEDRSGDLWVGSFGGGVQRVRSADRRSGRGWRFESLPFPEPAVAEARLVWKLLQDRSGRVWAATDDGVYWTDPQAIAWQRERAAGVPVPMAGARTLLEDARGRLWVGSSSGLGRIDAPGQARQAIAVGASATDEPWYREQDQNVYALYQDSEQRIWVGTWAGLHVLDAEGRLLATYRIADGLPGPIIWDIHRHSDGSLWLGTNGGLARVVNPEQVEQLRFEPTGRLAGLPQGMVYGVASDRQGLLWLTGNRGLVRLDPLRMTHRVWRRTDGLAADEFATGALATGAQGWLYFGGIDGITAVDPSQLREQPELPRPSLARAELGSDWLHLNPAAGARPPSLALRHDHPPLILDFSGLVYDTPQAARFRYRLDPSLAYTELGSRRSLILDRLPDGSHRLELSVENEGREAVAELLQIEVAPPYWATWLFRLLVALVVALALTLLYVRRMRTLTGQQRRLEAEVGARTRELRNQKEALEATAEALAAANAKLKTLSVMDPLTGLPNRRGLIERIGAMLSESPPPPLALGVIDLDQFKRINDEYGHLAGDAVLRDFADVARSQMQRLEVIGRWGGEEFLLLLPDADAETAQGWADELLARVRSRRVRSGHGVVSYRISIGLALAAPGDDMDALVARADGALYAAKSGGRDRVVLAGR